MNTQLWSSKVHQLQHKSFSHGHLKLRTIRVVSLGYVWLLAECGLLSLLQDHPVPVFFS